MANDDRGRLLLTLKAMLTPDARPSILEDQTHVVTLRAINGFQMTEIRCNWPVENRGR
jgi:hypothetical protein